VTHESIERLWHRISRYRLSVLVLLLALLIATVPLAPLIWVVFTALKNPSRVIENPLGPPTGAWHWENFASAWQAANFGTYFVNSLVVAIPTVLAVVVLSLLAAYPFAVMSFRLRKVLFTVFLAGLTIPLSVLIIPLFYEIRSLGLDGTPLALILPQVAIQLPFGILLLAGFIRELPREVLDAGRIDGCDQVQLLRHVVAPLTWPGVLTLVVFVFMWTWNQFLLPLVLVHQDSGRTLPLGLAFFQGRFNTNIPLMMAGATITFLPIVLVYVVFQRQFIRGITAGAIR